LTARRSKGVDEGWEKVGPRKACSSRGYCVTILGRAGVEYEEGGTTIRPESEALWGDAGFGLFGRSIQGTPERRAEVVERIRAGLEFLGFSLQVDDALEG
jgi:hypothetical protein